MLILLSSPRRIYQQLPTRDNLTISEKSSFQLLCAHDPLELKKILMQLNKNVKETYRSIDAYVKKAEKKSEEQIMGKVVNKQKKQSP